MLEQLKQEVYEANLLLPEYGLVIFTWGNVSAVSREQGRIVIKPSGVEYKDLTPEKMAVTDLEGRKKGDGYEPSSDTLTHAVLYERFPEIGAVVHTHSPWATSWAQAGRDIPVLWNDPRGLYLRGDPLRQRTDRGRDRGRV